MSHCGSLSSTFFFPPILSSSPTLLNPCLGPRSCCRYQIILACFSPTLSEGGGPQGPLLMTSWCQENVCLHGRRTVQSSHDVQGARMGLFSCPGVQMSTQNLPGWASPLWEVPRWPQAARGRVPASSFTRLHKLPL